MQQFPTFGAEAQFGLTQEFPAPPRIDWRLLALGWWVLIWVIDRYSPPRYLELLHSVVIDAWVFFLCVWIRKLNPNSRSAFWCDVYLVVELVTAALAARESVSTLIQAILPYMRVTSAALGIATIYLVRGDLLEHYNEREPIGLKLDPVMTLFLSFLYFQYHLNEISRFKKRQAEGFSDNPSRTLLR